MIRMNKGEQLDAALKRMDEVANLVDIDLSEFTESKEDTTEASPDVKLEQNDAEGVKTPGNQSDEQTEEEQQPTDTQETDSGTSEEE